VRFSIGKMMFVVAICGFDFFLISKIGTHPDTYGVERYFGELIIIGGLPMLNLLAILFLVRQPGRRDLDSLLGGGLVALALYLGVASLAGRPITEATIGLLEVVAPLRNPSVLGLVVRLTVAVLMHLLPQLAVAALLARLIRQTRGGTLAPADPGPRPPD
jgi:hypothetical protein